MVVCLHSLLGPEFSVAGGKDVSLPPSAEKFLSHGHLFPAFWRKVGEGVSERSSYTSYFLSHFNSK